MPRTKKQHYVPQFLLRRFATASSKNPKVWALDKRTKDVRLSSVRDVAHENSFYEYCDGEGTRFELEPLMAGIDSTGAEIIGRILDRGTLHLAPRDRVWLSYFVACQMSRTPMVRKEMENIWEMITHKWGPDVRVREDDRTVGEYGSEDSRLSSLMLIQDVPEFAKLLQTKVWVLSEAPKQCPFIIGDNPVTRHNMIDRWPRGNLGLKNVGIELYMPLSPRYSIHVICPVLAEAVLLTRVLREDCLNAVANGTPVNLQPENVEFVNSLQVIWSERFVFSRERTHMDMPLDMLSSNPELMDGPGVRQRPEDA